MAFPPQPQLLKQLLKLPFWSKYRCPGLCRITCTQHPFLLKLTRYLAKDNNGGPVEAVLSAHSVWVPVAIKTENCSIHRLLPDTCSWPHLSVVCLLDHDGPVQGGFKTARIWNRGEPPNHTARQQRTSHILPMSASSDLNQTPSSRVSDTQ